MLVDEKKVLEASLQECEKRLQRYRKEGNELQADLAEADMNKMLEVLGELYEREKHDEFAQH